jgi:hypothetical protein
MTYSSWRNKQMDERFIMHRFKSTRLATAVGLIMMVAWFNYELFVNDTMRVDLFVIVLAMGITKIGAMLYYRVSN